MNSARLVRAAFWALWAASVLLAAYDLCLLRFGVGWIFPDDGFPRASLRGEARLAGAAGLSAALGLALASFVIGKWSRKWQRLGYLTLAVLLFYWAVAP